MQSAKMLMTQDTRSNEDRRDVYEPDFIPYACHYNPHTLLTKNGELLQTIKIVGFANETIGQKRIKLRDAVRQALTGSLPNDDFAVWFHTIRRSHDLRPAGEHPDMFSKQVNERWSELHEWDKKYTNELYITVVHDSQEVRISTPQNFMRAMWPPAHRKYREKFFSEAYEELESTVQSMLKTLELFGAKRLSIVEKNGVYNSEMIEFLGKIINLGDTTLNIPVVDLCEYLPSKDVAFGYNVMEVKGASGRHFGAILTIKEYKELTAQSLDIFLQLPQEFIVSQCVDFINSEGVKSQYEYQKYILSLSGDEDLGRISGLQDIFNADRGKNTDYGQHQLSVLLINKSVAELEKSVERAVEALGKLGIVAVREDIRLEEAYWSLLPGNFEFVCRRAPINIGRVGGFTSLHNFPAGKFDGNHWGDAVSVLYTAFGTPYFFNFHRAKNGHTAIIGPHGAGKTVLLNFLCSEARKFNPKLFFFDKDRGSEIFLRAMGGSYYRLRDDAEQKKLKLNPLLMPVSDETVGFLTEWAWSLVTSEGEDITEEELEALHHQLTQLMKLPTQQRRISTLAALLNEGGQKRLGQMLSPWHGSGAYAFLFDHAEDTLNMDNPICGFEMGGIVEYSQFLNPVLLYLLYRVSLCLDGTPAMVVLDEAWHMLDNPLFAPKISPWLELLTQHNAMAILATESVEQAGQSQISGDIMQHIATSLFLPNAEAGSAYQEVFRLTEREFRLLQRMQLERRHFLLKHGTDALVAELDLSALKDILPVLSGHQESLHLFDKMTAELGFDPEDWLEGFQQICQQERRG